MQNISDYLMISLIPARGGSERVPRKNIKMMAGKPMLAWSIEASLNSKYISRTFVSTEDPEVKAIALQYGAEVIDRPAKYAEDTPPGIGGGHELYGVSQQFKELLWDEMKIYPNYLAWLYPTSPLRTAKQIDEAYELMMERNCQRAVTAYRIPLCYDGRYTINKQGRAERVFQYSQKEMYIRSMGILDFREPEYITTPDIFIFPFSEGMPFAADYNDLSLYEVNKELVVDVNTEFEFAMAEMILKERLKLTKWAG